MEIKDKDGNVFNGTAEELKKFFGKTTDLGAGVKRGPHVKKKNKVSVPEYDGALQADFVPNEKKKRVMGNKKRSFQRWSREEDLRLIGFFNDKSNRFANGQMKRTALLNLATTMGRSKKSIYLRFRGLGLRLRPAGK